MKLVTHVAEAAATAATAVTEERLQGWDQKQDVGEEAGKCR